MPDAIIRPRVLVADDQVDILEAIRFVLKDAGFDVDSASSTQAVRERLAGGRFDLLLMDLNYARDTTSGREGLELPLPVLPGCEVAAIWEPASDFGGDCYDAITLGGNRVGISIADVSGHGLPAAFLMSNLQASFRAFAARESSPQCVAASINRALCGNPTLRTFATFFYGVIDCAARTIAFCNAGHNPPILVRADGSVERLSTGGLVLGVFADTAYEGRDTTLSPGDRLVLFTDGLPEAENGEGVDFGDERLVEAVVKNRDQSAATLLEIVFAGVREFRGGPFADDATLIAIAIS